MELEEDETEGNGCGGGCNCLLALSQCSLASQPEAREPGMFLETEAAEPATEEAEAAAEA